MNEKLFITFVILNIVNVIIQTVKSLATVKCGKTVASIVNAVAYGLYTVVVVYTVCDLPLWLKVVVVGVANLIGVYVVKLIEEKSRKDKLWQITITIPKTKEKIADELLIGISHSKIELKDYNVYTCYCSTQRDTLEVTNICKTLKGKMFATENKLS